MVALAVSQESSLSTLFPLLGAFNCNSTEAINKFLFTFTVSARASLSEASLSPSDTHLVKEISSPRFLLLSYRSIVSILQHLLSCNIKIVI